MWYYHSKYNKRVGMNMLSQFFKDQSSHNQLTKDIYLCIYDNGPISRAEIITQTQINRGKVDRSLKELLDKGYICIIGQGNSEGGRPPTLYQINPKSSYIIGIQITRYDIRIVLFDLLFDKLNQKTIRMTVRHTPEVVIEEMKNTINEFTNAHHFTVNELLGIGIGAIGPLDREKGLILSSEPFLTHGWENISIVESIKETFPVLVKLDNGANTGVLAEYKRKQAYHNILNIIVGWTWGCGVILDGKLVNVESSDVSGYGHMVINMNGKDCFCGRKGCMVAYTSLYAILDKIKECSPYFFQEKLKDFTPAEQILNLLSEQDVSIRDVIYESAKYLGVGIANLATVFNSELVIVNGPLISKYPGYYEEIVHYISLNQNPKENIQFSKGDFDGDAMIVGAAIQVFDYASKNL